MDTIHTLAHQFAPRPQDGLAFSAMPDAPVLAVRTPRRATWAADLRRIGARLRTSFPLTTAAPAPVRADCVR
jgi:hypothetical protein